jgi:SET and MYND domain-containing protein
LISTRRRFSLNPEDHNLKLSIFLPDYSDLKQDKKRMEHFTSLYGVLIDFIGENNLPNSAELMGIYGRVSMV